VVCPKGLRKEAVEKRVEIIIESYIKQYNQMATHAYED
jgi:hypothetical protein